MKNKILAILLISSLLSVTVMAADTTADTAETVETETKYTDESGFSLWYNAESLAIGDYGGQFCFVPSDEEDALKSPAVFIIVPNEIGETPSPLNEVTAMYPPENVSEIKETTTDEGVTIQSVDAFDAGQNFVFYIVSYEDMSLNITSMILDEEHMIYAEEFDRIVDTISFEAISAEENTEEQAVISYTKE